MILGQGTSPAFVAPGVNWWALTPLLVLAGGALLLLVAAALTPRRWPKGWYAIATCIASGAALVLAIFLWYDVQDHGPQNVVGSELSLDGFSVFLTITICSAVFLTALMLDGYLRREGIDGPEIYGLVLACAAGGVVMVSANDLIVLFLGLEVLSLALYVLAGSHLRRVRSQEAALKYFILGAFSSAFFLYGIALVYGATGSTNFTKISQFLAQTTLLDDQMLLVGFGFLLVGLFFKVTAVPFHWWAPDVYQGSPSPATGFMASASKAAAFGALLRVFVLLFGSYRVDWRPVVFVVAVLTLLTGAVLATVQDDVKRMLAYSSIMHAGFMLVAIEAASSEGTAAVAFYLLTYSITVVASFGMLSVLDPSADGTHPISSFTGIGRRRPLIAFTFTVLLLSQAGVPFTTGFVAKFNVIVAAADEREYVIAVVSMIAAVIAAFLYLRIIVAMYLAPTGDHDEEETPSWRLRSQGLPVSAMLALMLAALFTLVFGIAPNLIIEFARAAVPAVASP